MANELYANADPGSHVAASIQRITDSKMWTGTAWETYNATHLATYAIPLTDQGGGFYAANWPATMPAGANCRVICRKWDNVTHHEADIRLSMYSAYWNGSATGTDSAVTIDPYALTTLAGVKRDLGITDATKDTILTEKINGASAFIETATYRKFKARDYRERVSWRPEGLFCTEQFPILSPVTAKYGNAVAMTVRCDVAGLIQAELGTINDCSSATAGMLWLRTWDASGVLSTHEFNFADYPSATLLAAAIVALGAGWAATVVNNCVSYDLNPQTIGSILATTQGVQYTNLSIVSYATDAIRGRVQISEAVAPYAYSRDRTLTRHPFDLNGFLIEYRAGFETIPADVEMVARELACRKYLMTPAGGRNPTVSSETTGPMQWTYTNKEADWVRDALSLYMDPSRKYRL